MPKLLWSLLLLAGLQVQAAVQVDNATVRMPLPGKTVSAGYFSMTNQSAEAVNLTGVTSEQFGSVELHQHAMQDGMMRMMSVEQIVVPAGKTVHLQPGGLHLMLFKPTKVLGLGTTLTLHLHWSDGSTQAVEATVTKIPSK